MPQLSGPPGTTLDGCFALLGRAEVWSTATEARVASSKCAGTLEATKWVPALPMAL